MSDMDSAAGGGGVQKAICTICFEDLKPIAEDLQTIPVCGHVFHELCIQQWLEYCPARKKPTCPVCKQSYSRQNITRLYFQSTGDSTQLSSSFSTQSQANAEVGALVEVVRKLEGKLAVLTTTFENQQAHLKNVEDELYACKQLAKREELRKDELKKEKEYFAQLLNNKMEELSIKTAEFVKLQEKSFALAKELASFKLATDLNLEEPDMVRLASISHGNNVENAVEVLTKSLARRNKSYKELMIQCNNIGRSETRACKKLDLANEKIDKLKIRLKEVEKVLEDKENEVLRDIKASSKLKPKQDNLSHIEQNVSRPAMEDQAMRLYAMKNLNHIANNNCFGQFCKAESNKLQEKSSPPVFKESNHAADFTADSFNHLNVDCLKLISESDGHPSPVVECENGQADQVASLMSGIRSSSKLNAESYAHTKVIAGVAYCESGNDSKDVKESAPAYIKRKMSHTMNMKAAKKILTDDAQNEVPYLTAMQETQVFQSPAFLGANSSRGRWCRQIQQSSSGSGDLIAVGADGKGGRIKVLKSQEQFLGGSKRPKHGAKPRSQFNMEHFFVKQTR